MNNFYPTLSYYAKLLNISLDKNIVIKQVDYINKNIILYVKDRSLVNFLKGVSLETLYSIGIYDLYSGEFVCWSKPKLSQKSNKFKIYLKFSKNGHSINFKKGSDEKEVNIYFYKYLKYALNE